MKITFTILVGLLMVIAALLFTGHPGAAEKLSITAFALLSGSVVFALFLHDEKQP